MARAAKQASATQTEQATPVEAGVEAPVTETAVSPTEKSKEKKGKKEKKEKGPKAEKKEKKEKVAKKEKAKK